MRKLISTELSQISGGNFKATAYDWSEWGLCVGSGSFMGGLTGTLIFSATRFGFHGHESPNNIPSGMQNLLNAAFLMGGFLGGYRGNMLYKENQMINKK